MRQTAGELSKKALADNTKYDAREVGQALADDITPHLRQCIENHKNIIDENEFCIVMVIAEDPLIHNLKRRKFYAWPYLPKPRPNQTVFLYNKGKDTITHRLWILPSDIVMAELHCLSVVAKEYVTLKAWSDAFYKAWKFIKYKPFINLSGDDCFLDTKGNVTKNPGYFVNTDPFYFWNFVRADQKINMPSEHEYFLQHRQELIEAGCKIPDATYSEPFDFGKIEIKQIVDTQTAVSQ